MVISQGKTQRGMRALPGHRNIVINALNLTDILIITHGRPHIAPLRRDLYDRETPQV